MARAQILLILALCAPAWADEGSPGGASEVALRYAPVAPEPGPALRSEQVREGSLRRRLAEDPADLVLLFGGEQEGLLGTCGCGESPRGSLGRAARYAAAVRSRSEAPVLLLSPGGSMSAMPDLDGTLRGDAVAQDENMAEALALGGWDAVNVGFQDLPWVGRNPLALGISANVVAPAGQLAPRTHVLVEAGGLRVAVTGVSSDGLRHLQPEGWTWADPVESLERLVPTLQADVVVVLAYEPGALAAKLARVPGVDVLIEAGGYAGAFEPSVEGEAIWARSRDRSETLGELRLQLQDGRVVAATERKVDMDVMIPTSPAFLRLEREAARDGRKALQAIYGDLL